MAKKVTNIEVKDTTVRTIKHEGEDFVCITDIARQKNSGDPNGVIANSALTCDRRAADIDGDGQIAESDISKLVEIVLLARQ